MSDLTALLWFAENPTHLALAIAAVVLAYTVFTLVGFGSALMASGPLALLMPVARVIPLLALMDFAGSAMRGWRARHDVAWGEFRQLLPGMLSGQLLGVLVLARLPTALMAVALGLFVMVQGIRGLVGQGDAVWRPACHPMAYGLFGGILGGLFGSGGFVYAAYLERRLESRAGFRATQGLLIALSTAWRIVLCISAGLVDIPLLLTTMVFVPGMVLGGFLGRHIDLRLTREQLFRLLNALLVVSGLGLLLRFAG
ncbi:MAG TPA: sulfite exporter TauE/SafE family protein [Azonexus sp.]|nr:sulfite exporter TauE/SafE family protein [Azonexus sp.]